MNMNRRCFLLSSFSCLFLTLYPRLSFAGCTQGDDVKKFNANNTVPSHSEGMVAVIVNWYNSTVVVPLLISAAVIMSSNPLIHPDSGAKTTQDSANTDVSEAQQRAVLSDLIDKAMTAASPSDFFPSEHGSFAQGGGGFNGGIGGGGGSHLTDKPFQGD